MPDVGAPATYRPGMKTSRVASTFAAAVLACAPLAVAAPAEASTTYSSCAKLTKVFKNGVAKNAAAAKRAVRNGHPRPSSTARAKKVYAKNFKRLDRDRDGVACER